MRLLDDAALRFPTLYALRGELAGTGPGPEPNRRNLRALRLTADLPARVYRAEEGDPRSCGGCC
jgi:hypothetical protein